MESANFHHQHQLQDQLVGSSSLTTPSSYGVSNFHGWTQNISLNAGIIRPFNSSMVQDLSFHWSNTGGTFNNQYAYELQQPKIKGGLSGCFPNFTDMSVDSPSSTVEDSNLSFTNYVKNEQKDLNDLRANLLLKTISSGFPISGYESSGEIYPQNSSMLRSDMPNRGKFSQMQIHPSLNVSNLNQSISGSFDMNLQASDLLSSTSSSGGFGQPCNDILAMYKDNFSFSLDQMQQSSQRPSSKILASFDAKRPNSLMEPKATQAAAKKSRVESRAASCPPLKIRKEKLGDRIAALQQLVAPFGKTDTASVLMEAIGYIKFLQNQVETLSVPYMMATRSRFQVGGGNEEVKKRDLRSRGLCLVPLSCMSYLTSDAVGGGGAMWLPPNFGGAT
ncbi:hypothetical protein K2173_007543 [Erythroxylum novogranatense]|uniref:BHLH domain-containing protein n=1 Tax=Erythroxylum novogranatense TaxID=1862640 RepID=A0AAV8T7U5_9ROSI|nr:hypothetical protein K2173_007543 [Erythroxylum novogranatense]